MISSVRPTCIPRSTRADNVQIVSRRGLFLYGSAAITKLFGEGGGDVLNLRTLISSKLHGSGPWV